MFEKDPPGRLDNSPHSPHSVIPKLIKEEKALILDVGCNTGMVGKEIIRRKSAIVDGIDINNESLRQAKEAYRKVFQRDLSQENVEIDKEKYDYIIFSDILEHLPRPDLTLLIFRKYLKDDGKIIISLPNVARLEIRMGLLLGNFDYKPGIMSEDHLRFFTKKSATELIEKCGYKILNITPTGFGHRFKILTTLTAFQFVYVCKKIV